MIRKSTISDIDRIMPLYEQARRFMRATGNPMQWINGYPERELIATDIYNDNLYIIEHCGRIVAAFTFIIGSDPTYNTIQGQWLNDLPYGTIHRLVSDGSLRGISDLCFDHCFNIIDNIRIDTHRDNRYMRQAILRNGFAFCGIIRVADGSPRLAYQKHINNYK